LRSLQRVGTPRRSVQSSLSDSFPQLSTEKLRLLVTNNLYREYRKPILGTCAEYPPHKQSSGSRAIPHRRFETPANSLLRNILPASHSISISCRQTPIPIPPNPKKPKILSNRYKKMRSLPLASQSAAGIRTPDGEPARDLIRQGAGPSKLRLPHASRGSKRGHDAVEI